MDVVKAARQLRANGKIRESYELVQSSSTVPQGLVWQHQPCFWDELAAGKCLLTRRTGTDAVFIRTLWEDRDFIHQFHRRAPNLPPRQEDLERILNSEYASLVSDLNSLHWVVRDEKRTPWGVLSLVNISLAHRRAEVLLGVRGRPPLGLAPAAMLGLFRFWFEVLKFQKLYTLTFDDNPHARRSTLHLGFKEEGRFRRHFYDTSTKRFVDMVQVGLLAEEAFSDANRRLMKRLNFKLD